MMKICLQYEMRKTKLAHQTIWTRGLIFVSPKSMEAVSLPSRGNIAVVRESKSCPCQPAVHLLSLLAIVYLIMRDFTTARNFVTYMTSEILNSCTSFMRHLSLYKSSFRKPPAVNDSIRWFLVEHIGSSGCWATETEFHCCISFLKIN